MKNFDEFVKEVVRGIEERLGGKIYVTLEKILKNNECEFVSVLIHKQPEDDKTTKVTPAIYMEHWYDLYCDGYLLEDIVSEIICVYEASLDEIKNLEDINYSKENIASHIFFRVINAGFNKRLLEKSPHILFEDLAITFHYMCSNDGKMLQSFRITESIAESWKINKQELYEYAMMNTPMLFPEKFMSLKNVILKCSAEMMSFEDEVETACENEIPMYVLTNETGYNGASSMFYSVYLKKLAEKVQCDIYILPSSIHEVILIPSDIEMSVNELEELVREVNENHVEIMERLSDNVYIYSKENGKITLAGINNLLS